MPAACIVERRLTNPCLIKNSVSDWLKEFSKSQDRIPQPDYIVSHHCQPPVRRSEGPRPERLTERHFPSLIPLTDAAKERGDRKNHHKNCALCPKPLYADKPFSRSRTEFECKKCNVALCAAPCFQKYHTILQL